MKKILVVNIPSGEENSPFGEWAKNVYMPMTKRNLDLVKGPDTEFTYRFSTWGMGPERTAFYRYLDHLASRKVFYLAQHAEEEGFDGVIVNCCGDPTVWELRQALNIPVVGILEAALLQSNLIAPKIGIVHISPYNIPETMEKVVSYHQGEHVVACKPIHGWENADLEEAMVDSTKRVTAFIETARELIDMGAEAILPACSLLSPTVRFTPGMEGIYPDGLTSVDGAAIIDVESAAVKMLENLIDLRRGGSSWISRKFTYAQPDAELLAQSSGLLDAGSIHYWDIVF